MEKRWLNLFAVFFFVVVFSVVLSGCEQSYVGERGEEIVAELNYPDVKDFEGCINRLKNERHTEISSGEIIVVFNKNITQTQINNLLKEYKLDKKKYSYNLLRPTILVPNGSEEYWICKFRNISTKVKQAHFNFILKIAEND